MSTGKKNVPEIRFGGFSEPWAQCKFRDTFDIMQNNALSRADLSSAGGDVMNVHYGDVLVKYGEVLDVKKDEMTYLLDASLVNKHLASLLQNRDIIIADAAEDETVGKCSEIAGLTDEKVLSGLHTIPCRPRGNFAEGYLGYYMNSGSYHDQLLPLIQGAKVSSISKSVIQDTDIMYPKAETEQRQIGTYFRSLDNLITLHQHKYEALVAVKKAMLEKMFPKEGETVPQIRFAGFTDPWEQRKLGDVGKARSGVGFPNSEQCGTTGTPFFKVSDMNLDGNENEMIAANNYVTAAQIAAHRWSPIEELPAIFFAKVGAAVMLNRKRLCRFPFLLDNNTMAYSLNNTKWNADFAKALFETLDLTSLVQVGALPSYNAGDIEAMEILLPSLSEQSQIGAFFKKIDNLITLHQRKCEVLKNLKSALLNKMFVNTTE